MPSRRIPDKATSRAGPNDRADEPPQSERPLMWQQLLMDTCDLFVPGQALGWFPVASGFVGTLMLLSTLVAGRRIWQRVNSP